jgi:hypothetical protein
MNALLVSTIVFGCVFAAALVGMAMRRALPEEHLGPDGKEVVRLSTALISTMAAIILGMLVSSAKASYDARKNEVAEMSSEILTIDRLLARYGEETGDLRVQFRHVVEDGAARIWPKDGARDGELRPEATAEVLVDRLEHLTPKNEYQAAAKAQVLPQVFSLRQTQWLMFLKTQQSSIPRPLLIILVVWLAGIFLSFGLFAPTNPTVLVTLGLSALAVSAAIFLILEMYTPFSGILRISPAPVMEALSQMGR